MKLSDDLNAAADGFETDGAAGLAHELRRLAHNHRAAAAYQGRAEIDPEQVSTGGGCDHPPAALYSWYARHDGMPGGRVLVVTCKACGKVLQGGADLEE